MLNDRPAKTKLRFTVAARLKSFEYAFQGIVFMLRTQHNAWLHGLITLLVILFALYCGLEKNEWLWLIAAISMVWFAETMNTAVEYLCNVVSPDYSEAVMHAKDIAAGAVLIASIAATLIGFMTFWPYLTELMGLDHP